MKSICMSKKGMFNLLLALFCVAALMTTPEVAFGQQVTASITGKVTDPTGAAVAGAKVSAKDLDRGTVLNTESTAEGSFNLPRVAVGTWEVRVEMKGFSTSVLPPFKLEMNQIARYDVQLKVGEISETIEVTGAAPLLNTDTMQVGTVIDNKVNEALPLASRNYIQLTMLAPGVTNPDPSSMKNPLTTGQSGRPYVNGNREQSNNFLLDGLDNNQVSDNVAGYTPAPDAIQEFNMITSNAPADFGNFQGGVVSATIRSGTNELHGSVYEFLRNDALNAADWAAKWSCAMSNCNEKDVRARMRWNMFGATIGGPIKKDKLFFFGDYAGVRYKTPAASGPISLITMAERGGDFSALLGRGIQLYNPFSTRPDPQNPNKMIRDPFPNNQIPISLINPVAQKLFANNALYPTPTNNGLGNNFINTSSSNQRGDQYDVKMDYNMTEKDKFSGRYSQSWQKNPSDNSTPLLFGSFWQAPTQSGVVDWTRTLSNTLVNDFRMGVSYVSLWNGGTDHGLGNVAEELGITNGNDRGSGLFNISLGGGFAGGFGNANIGTQQKFPSTVIQFEDILIKTKGAHTMHFGGQVFRKRINPFYAGNYGRTGIMNFSGRYTAGPGIYSVSGSGSGVGEADFFLGLPDVVERGVNSGSWGQRSTTLGFFFQDTWRVNNNFTMNYGLRYETHSPWVEVKDRQVNFDPFSGAIQVAGKSSLYSNSRALYNSYNWGIGNFQPRFGFSWNPDYWSKKFLIRGAYTVSSYLEGTGTNLRLPLNPPNNQEYRTSYEALPLPLSRTQDGMTVLTSSSDPFANAVIRLWDPNIKPAIAYQWSLNAEYSFKGNTTLQLGYVGQKGTHLMNPMPYFQRQLEGVDATGKPITSPSPYLAGNPALANIGQISGTESNGTMRYDALQAVLRRRMSSGLQYQISYTWSHAMEDSAGYYGSWGGQTTPPGCYWQNLYDRRSEWGPSFFDVRHMLTSYVVYELPVGKGKKVGSNWNPVARNILGNWAVTGILTLRGGFPSNVYGDDNTGTGSRSPRATYTGAPKITYGTSKNAPDGGYQWFDPAPYRSPYLGTFGNVGNGAEYGPGMTNLDMSLQKNFQFTERARMEFRAEFINFTNTPILGGPGVWLGGGLGKVQGSQGARNIQFGLKIYY